MLGKLLLGGIVVCVAVGAYVGWRFAREAPALPSALPAWVPDVFAAAPEPRVELEPIPRDETEHRIESVAPDGPAARADAEARSEPEAVDPSIEALVQALRDDGIPGNAMKAISALLSEGAAAHAALVRALDSTDEQQRALAACVLAYSRGSPAPPALARELLALFTPPPGERFHELAAKPWLHRIGRANCDERRAAFTAFETDARLFAMVEGELETRMRGHDPVLRFDAARIVLAHPSARERRTAFEVLVEHLADNDVDDDAAMAMRLLDQHATEALPIVRASLPGRDAQSARLLAHFLAYHDPRHAAADRLRPRELSGMGFDAGDMLARR